MWIYKCMLNVYKNQQNRQTGSRNLTGPKTLLTIWYTYKNKKKLCPLWALYWTIKILIRFLPSTVTEKNILEGRKDRGKTVYPPPPSGVYWLIDYLLLNVERTVFQLYSGREKVQQYIKTNLHSSGRISLKIWHINWKYDTLVVLISFHPSITWILSNRSALLSSHLY
jgi:hypothetical protein